MRRKETLGFINAVTAIGIDSTYAALRIHSYIRWASWPRLIGSVIAQRANAIADEATDGERDPRLHDLALLSTAAEESRQPREQRPRPGMPADQNAEFDAFFNRFQQPLYGYLRRLVPSDDIAIELAQEALFRAWKHFAELRAYDRPDAWLYRVATNLAISHLRRRKSVSFTQFFSRSHEAEVADAPEEPAPFADPLDVEGRIVERDAIERVLRQLPERQRAALLLRAAHGLSCEEIAAALGITVVNARQTLSRARERFREIYEATQRET